MKTNDKALNTASEEEVGPEASPAEDKASEEVEEAEVESTDEAEEEPTETEEKVQKKGYSKRVQELANKARDAEERAQSLEETIAALTGRVDQPADPQGNQPQYSPQVEPGAEISPEQYKQDVMRSADALVSLKIKQSEAVNRINNEASEVIRNTPELDPDSDDFNIELSETVTAATEAYVKANPYTASVKKFVAKLMKPYKGAVTKEVGRVTEQVAKQAKESSLKPTPVRKAEKTAAEMTPEELERKLGIVVS